MDFAVDAHGRDRVVTYAASLGYETLHVSDAFSNHGSSESRLGRVDFMYVSGPTADRIFGATTVKAIVGNVSAPVAIRSIWR